MSCQLDVATEVKQDILDCSAAARRQIGDFLAVHQENPFPEGRRQLGRAKDGSAFYAQLPCGFYVSWEIAGNPMHLALTGKTKGILVRILGIARIPPK
jgi:hypothetical protein